MTGRKLSKGGSEGLSLTSKDEEELAGVNGAALGSVRSQRRNSNKSLKKGYKSLNKSTPKNIPSYSSLNACSSSSMSSQATTGDFEKPAGRNHGVGDPANYYRLFKVIKRKENMLNDDLVCSQILLAVVNLVKLCSRSSQLEQKNYELPFSSFLKTSLDEKKLIEFLDTSQIVTLGARLRDIMM